MSKNRLAKAASPYLRQHADNPVWWQPWDEEALRQAQEEGKPIFLSIGYSACHWCHVMEHECFQDEEVAALLNEHFVSIKVDREERPDVDEAYMTALQLTRGGGGWPLSAFLTPTGEPFLLGTYFPKEDRGDHPGFRTLLHSVIRAWRQDRASLEAAAKELARAVAEVNRMAMPPGKLTLDGLQQAVQKVLSRFDKTHGGFLGSPKFPPHSSLLLLLDWIESGENQATDARAFVERTLEGMMLGGIRDHVGGGFHRYSTDHEWHLPHFEKMLYDNALLLEVCARAGRLLGRQDFLEVAEETAGFLLREMTASDGTLYSAMDADSEGGEGAFYTWTVAEIRDVLGDAAEGFIQAYGLTEEGNFREEATGHQTGANVLHAREPLGKRLTKELELLRSIRETRPRPALDDKRLLAWNGLAIRALAIAGFGTEAKRCAEAWLAYDPLPHQLSDDQALGKPFLDAAYFVHGLLALGEAYRDAAQAVYTSLSQTMRDENGGWTLSAAEHNSPLGRSVPLLDSALPSPYGHAVLCAVTLGELEIARQDIARVSGWMIKAPGATTTLWRAFLALTRAGGRVSPQPAPIPKIILFPKTAHVTAGRAEYTVTVEAPEGWQIQPGVSLEVDGLSSVLVRQIGENGEQRAMLEFSGEPPTGSEGEGRALLRFQVCSDRECLPTEEVEIPLAWRR